MRSSSSGLGLARDRDEARVAVDTLPLLHRRPRMSDSRLHRQRAAKASKQKEKKGKKHDHMDWGAQHSSLRTMFLARGMLAGCDSKPVSPLSGAVVRFAPESGITTLYLGLKAANSYILSSLLLIFFLNFTAESKHRVQGIDPSKNENDRSDRPALIPRRPYIIGSARAIQES